MFEFVGSAVVGSNFLGIYSIVLFLRSSKRRRFIASWLMMWELQNHTWLSLLVSLVERHDVLFVAAVLTRRCATVCAFADLGISPMMCGIWNGTSVDRLSGLTMCGSAPGVFLLVARWRVRVFFCMILFDMGLFATIVCGASLTL